MPYNRPDVLLQMLPNYRKSIHISNNNLILQILQVKTLKWIHFQAIHQMTELGVHISLLDHCHAKIGLSRLPYCQHIPRPNRQFWSPNLTRLEYLDCRTSNIHPSSHRAKTWHHGIWANNFHDINLSNNYYTRMK